MPRTVSPAFCIFLNASRNPHASMVQPGVSALGKKKRTTFCPRSSFRRTIEPFSSDKLKSGAFLPSVMSLPLRRKLYPTSHYRVISAVLMIGVLLCGTNASAQYRSTRKEHKGPRAIAVIEFPQAPKDSKTPVKYAPRLIPAIILNEGKYF